MDSTARLAAERVTLDDMSVGDCGKEWQEKR